MARNRFSEEDMLGILCQIELELASDGTVENSVCAAGISDATYYKLRKTYSSMGKSKLHKFKPDSPWENGYNERFNGTLRKEVLNAKWFSTIKQAQIVINVWLRQYSQVQPHQSLNMRPPAPKSLNQNGT